MISCPYPSKGTVKTAAKAFAEQAGIKKIVLLVDVEAKQYFYSDEAQAAPGSKMLVFSRLQRARGKWHEVNLKGRR